MKKIILGMILILVALICIGNVCANDLNNLTSDDVISTNNQVHYSKLKNNTIESDNCVINSNMVNSNVELKESDFGNNTLLNSNNDLLSFNGALPTDNVLSGDGRHIVFSNISKYDFKDYFLIRVVDGNGNNLTRGYVDFFVNDTFVSTSRVGYDGIAYFDLNQSVTTGGTYNVDCVYSVDEYSSDVVVGSKSIFIGNLSSKDRDIQILFEGTKVYDLDGVYTVRVVDSKGRGVSKGYVDFVYLNRFFTSPVDDDGYASFVLSNDYGLIGHCFIWSIYSDGDLYDLCACEMVTVGTRGLDSLYDTSFSSSVPKWTVKGYELRPDGYYGRIDDVAYSLSNGFVSRETYHVINFDGSSYILHNVTINNAASLLDFFDILSGQKYRWDVIVLNICPKKIKGSGSDDYRRFNLNDGISRKNTWSDRDWTYCLHLAYGKLIINGNDGVILDGRNHDDNFIYVGNDASVVLNNVEVHRFRHVFMNHGPVSCFNCTFNGNVAYTKGLGYEGSGAVCQNFNTIVFSNCSFYKNKFFSDKHSDDHEGCILFASPGSMSVFIDCSFVYDSSAAGNKNGLYACKNSMITFFTQDKDIIENSFKKSVIDKGSSITVINSSALKNNASELCVFNCSNVKELYNAFWMINSFSPAIEVVVNLKPVVYNINYNNLNGDWKKKWFDGKFFLNVGSVPVTINGNGATIKLADKNSENFAYVSKLGSLTLNNMTLDNFVYVLHNYGTLNVNNCIFDINCKNGDTSGVLKSYDAKSFFVNCTFMDNSNTQNKIKIFTAEGSYLELINSSVCLNVKNSKGCGVVDDSYVRCINSHNFNFETKGNSIVQNIGADRNESIVYFNVSDAASINGVYDYLFKQNHEKNYCIVVINFTGDCSFDFGRFSKYKYVFILQGNGFNINFTSSFNVWSYCNVYFVNVSFTYYTYKLFVNEGSCTFVNCTFSNMRCDMLFENKGLCNLLNCSFMNNHCKNLICNNGLLVVDNGLFMNNDCSQYGVIYNKDGSFLCNNVTFKGNSKYDISNFCTGNCAVLDSRCTIEYEYPKSSYTLSKIKSFCYGIAALASLGIGFAVGLLTGPCLGALIGVIVTGVVIGAIAAHEYISIEEATFRQDNSVLHNVLIYVEFGVGCALTASQGYAIGASLHQKLFPHNINNNIENIGQQLNEMNAAEAGENIADPNANQPGIAPDANQPGINPNANQPGTGSGQRISLDDGASMDNSVLVDPDAQNLENGYANAIESELNNNLNDLKNVPKEFQHLVTKPISNINAVIGSKTAVPISILTAVYHHSRVALLTIEVMVKIMQYYEDKNNFMNSNPNHEIHIDNPFEIQDSINTIDHFLENNLHIVNYRSQSFLWMSIHHGNLASDDILVLDPLIDASTYDHCRNETRIKKFLDVFSKARNIKKQAERIYPGGIITGDREDMPQEIRRVVNFVECCEYRDILTRGMINNYILNDNSVHNSLEVLEFEVAIAESKLREFQIQLSDHIDIYNFNSVNSEILSIFQQLKDRNMLHGELLNYYVKYKLCHFDDKDTNSVDLYREILHPIRSIVMQMTGQSSNNVKKDNNDINTDSNDNINTDINTDINTGAKDDVNVKPTLNIVVDVNEKALNYSHFLVKNGFNGGFNRPSFVMGLNDDNNTKIVLIKEIRSSMNWLKSFNETVYKKVLKSVFDDKKSFDEWAAANGGMDNLPVVKLKDIYGNCGSLLYDYRSNDYWDMESYLNIANVVFMCKDNEKYYELLDDSDKFMINCYLLDECSRLINTFNGLMLNDGLKDFSAELAGVSDVDDISIKHYVKLRDLYLNLVQGDGADEIFNLSDVSALSADELYELLIREMPRLQLIYNKLNKYVVVDGLNFRDSYLSSLSKLVNLKNAGSTDKLRDLYNQAKYSKEQAGILCELMYRVYANKFIDKKLSESLTMKSLIRDIWSNFLATETMIKSGVRFDGSDFTYLMINNIASYFDAILKIRKNNVDFFALENMHNDINILLHNFLLKGYDSSLFGFNCADFTLTNYNKYYGFEISRDTYNKIVANVMPKNDIKKAQSRFDNVTGAYLLSHLDLLDYPLDVMNISNRLNLFKEAFPLGYDLLIQDISKKYGDYNYNIWYRDYTHNELFNTRNLNDPNRVSYSDFCYYVVDSMKKLISEFGVFDGDVIVNKNIRFDFDRHYDNDNPYNNIFNKPHFYKILNNGNINKYSPDRCIQEMDDDLNYLKIIDAELYNEVIESIFGGCKSAKEYYNKEVFTIDGFNEIYEKIFNTLGKCRNNDEVIMLNNQFDAIINNLRPIDISLLKNSAFEKKLHQYLLNYVLSWHVIKAPYGHMMAQYLTSWSIYSSSNDLNKMYEEYTKILSQTFYGDVFNRDNFDLLSLNDMKNLFLNDLYKLYRTEGISQEFSLVKAAVLDCMNIDDFYSSIYVSFRTYENYIYNINSKDKLKDLYHEIDLILHRKDAYKVALMFNNIKAILKSSSDKNSFIGAWDLIYDSYPYVGSFISQEFLEGVSIDKYLSKNGWQKTVSDVLKFLEKSCYTKETVVENYPAEIIEDISGLLNNIFNNLDDLKVPEEYGDCDYEVQNLYGCWLEVIAKYPNIANIILKNVLNDNFFDYVRKHGCDETKNDIIKYLKENPMGKAENNALSKKFNDILQKEFNRNNQPVFVVDGKIASELSIDDIYQYIINNLKGLKYKTLIDSYNNNASNFYYQYIKLSVYMGKQDSMDDILKMHFYYIKEKLLEILSDIVALQGNDIYSQGDMHFVKAPADNLNKATLHQLADDEFNRACAYCNIIGANDPELAKRLKNDVDTLYALFTSNKANYRFAYNSFTDELNKLFAYVFVKKSTKGLDDDSVSKLIDMSLKQAKTYINNIRAFNPALASHLEDVINDDFMKSISKDDLKYSYNHLIDDLNNMFILDFYLNPKCEVNETISFVKVNIDNLNDDEIKKLIDDVLHTSRDYASAIEQSNTCFGQSLKNAIEKQENEIYGILEDTDDYKSTYKYLIDQLNALFTFYAPAEVVYDKNYQYIDLIFILPSLYKADKSCNIAGLRELLYYDLLILKDNDAVLYNKIVNSEFKGVNDVYSYLSSLNREQLSSLYSNIFNMLNTYRNNTAVFLNENDVLCSAITSDMAFVDNFGLKNIYTVVPSSKISDLCRDLLNCCNNMIFNYQKSDSQFKADSLGNPLDNLNTSYNKLSNKFKNFNNVNVAEKDFVEIYNLYWSLRYIDKNNDHLANVNADMLDNGVLGDLIISTLRKYFSEFTNHDIANSKHAFDDSILSSIASLRVGVKDRSIFPPCLNDAISRVSFLVKMNSPDSHRELVDIFNIVKAAYTLASFVHYISYKMANGLELNHYEVFKYRDLNYYYAAIWNMMGIQDKIFRDERSDDLVFKAIASALSKHDYIKTSRSPIVVLFMMNVVNYYINNGLNGLPDYINKYNYNNIKLSDDYFVGNKAIVLPHEIIVDLNKVNVKKFKINSYDVKFDKLNKPEDLVLLEFKYDKLYDAWVAYDKDGRLIMTKEHYVSLQKGNDPLQVQGSTCNPSRIVYNADGKALLAKNMEYIRNRYSVDGYGRFYYLYLNSVPNTTFVIGKLYYYPNGNLVPADKVVVKEGYVYDIYGNKLFSNRIGDKYEVNVNYYTFNGKLVDFNDLFIDSDGYVVDKYGNLLFKELLKKPNLNNKIPSWDCNYYTDEIDSIINLMRGKLINKNLADEFDELKKNYENLNKTGDVIVLNGIYNDFVKLYMKNLRESFIDLKDSANPYNNIFNYKNHVNNININIVTNLKDIINNDLNVLKIIDEKLYNDIMLDVFGGCKTFNDFYKHARDDINNGFLLNVRLLEKYNSIFDILGAYRDNNALLDSESSRAINATLTNNPNVNLFGLSLDELNIVGKTLFNRINNYYYFILKYKMPGYDDYSRKIGDLIFNYTDFENSKDVNFKTDYINSIKRLITDCFWADAKEFLRFFDEKDNFKSLSAGDMAEFLNNNIELLYKFTRAYNSISVFDGNYLEVQNKIDYIVKHDADSKSKLTDLYDYLHYHFYLNVHWSHIKDMMLNRVIMRYNDLSVFFGDEIENNLNIIATAYNLNPLLLNERDLPFMWEKYNEIVSKGSYKVDVINILNSKNDLAKLKWLCMELKEEKNYTMDKFDTFHLWYKVFKWNQTSSGYDLLMDRLKNEFKISNIHDLIGTLYNGKLYVYNDDGQKVEYNELCDWVLYEINEIIGTDAYLDKVDVDRLDTAELGDLTVGTLKKYFFLFTANEIVSSVGVFENSGLMNLDLIHGLDKKVFMPCLDEAISNISVLVKENSPDSRLKLIGIFDKVKKAYAMASFIHNLVNKMMNNIELSINDVFKYNTVEYYNCAYWSLISACKGKLMHDKNQDADYVKKVMMALNHDKDFVSKSYSPIVIIYLMDVYNYYVNNGIEGMLDYIENYNFDSIQLDDKYFIGKNPIAQPHEISIDLNNVNVKKFKINNYDVKYDKLLKADDLVLLEFKYDKFYDTWVAFDRNGNSIVSKEFYVSTQIGNKLLSVNGHDCLPDDVIYNADGKALLAKNMEYMGGRNCVDGYGRFYYQYLSGVPLTKFAAGKLYYYANGNLVPADKISVRNGYVYDNFGNRLFSNRIGDKYEVNVNYYTFDGKLVDFNNLFIDNDGYVVDKYGNLLFKQPLKGNDFPDKISSWECKYYTGEIDKIINLMGEKLVNDALLDELNKLKQDYSQIKATNDVIAFNTIYNDLIKLYVKNVRESFIDVKDNTNPYNNIFNYKNHVKQINTVGTIVVVLEQDLNDLEIINKTLYDDVMTNVFDGFKTIKHFQNNLLKIAEQKYPNSIKDRKDYMFNTWLEKYNIIFDILGTYRDNNALLNSESSRLINASLINTNYLKIFTLSLDESKVMLLNIFVNVTKYSNFIEKYNPELYNKYKDQYSDFLLQYVRLGDSADAKKIQYYIMGGIDFIYKLFSFDSTDCLALFNHLDNFRTLSVEEMGEYLNHNIELVSKFYSSILKGVYFQNMVNHIVKYENNNAKSKLIDIYIYLNYFFKEEIISKSLFANVMHNEILSYNDLSILVGASRYETLLACHNMVGIDEDIRQCNNERDWPLILEKYNQKFSKNSYKVDVLNILNSNKDLNKLKRLCMDLKEGKNYTMIDFDVFNLWYKSFKWNQTCPVGYNSLMENLKNTFKISNLHDLKGILSNGELFVYNDDAEMIKYCELHDWVLSQITQYIKDHELVWVNPYTLTKDNLNEIMLEIKLDKNANLYDRIFNLPKFMQQNQKNIDLSISLFYDDLSLLKLINISLYDEILKLEFNDLKSYTIKNFTKYFKSNKNFYDKYMHIFNMLGKYRNNDEICSKEACVICDMIKYRNGISPDTFDCYWDALDEKERLNLCKYLLDQCKKLLVSYQYHKDSWKTNLTNLNAQYDDFKNMDLKNINQNDFKKILAIYYKLFGCDIINNPLKNINPNSLTNEELGQLLINHISSILIIDCYDSRVQHRFPTLWTTTGHVSLNYIYGKILYLIQHDTDESRTELLDLFNYAKDGYDYLIGFYYVTIIKASDTNKEYLKMDGDFLLNFPSVEDCSIIGIAKGILTHYGLKFMDFNSETFYKLKKLETNDFPLYYHLIMDDVLKCFVDIYNYITENSNPDLAVEKINNRIKMLEETIKSYPENYRQYIEITRILHDLGSSNTLEVQWEKVRAVYPDIANAVQTNLLKCDIRDLIDKYDLFVVRDWIVFYLRDYLKIDNHVVKGDESIINDGCVIGDGYMKWKSLEIPISQDLC